MNWNPFKKVKVFPVTANEARMPSRDIFVLVERPAEAVQEQSGWDALSDYQKAARIEYRALQGLRYGRIVPEPYSGLGNLGFAGNQQSALYNQVAAQQNLWVNPQHSMAGSIAASIFGQP